MIRDFSSIHQLLTDTAARHSDRPALIREGGEVVPYGELASLSARYAAAIADRVNDGARVGILARNSPEAVAAYFAIHALGGVAVWLNHTQDAAALAAIAGDSELSLLLCEDALAGRAGKILPGRQVAFASLSGAPTPAHAARHARSGDEMAAIVYTSGSTDRPLGVMLSHRNLLANTDSIVRYLELVADDRAHCVLPFYYIYGLSVLLTHLAVGGSVFLENRFSFPQTAADSLISSGATGFSGVSTHYAVLLEQTDLTARDIPKLRYLAHAGDRMPPALALKLAGLFPSKKIFLMYGQTEAAPRLAFLDPAKVASKPDSAGQAIPGVQLKVADENGNECAPGVEGEIWASGPNIMMGYWKQPEETAAALRDGWLRTGDIARRDADGDLFVVGRKKLFLKVGGHRVSPLEIESVTSDYPGVAQAAAVGIPDEVLGQRIRICIVESGSLKVNLEGLAQHYRNKLPLYKTPAEAVILTELPKNEQGKLDRRRLSELRVEPMSLGGREAV